MKHRYTLSEIVEALGGTVDGDPLTKIERVGSLTSAQSNQIAFVSSDKYLKLIDQCKASAFVLKQAHASYTDKPKIIVDNPYAYFAKISSFLNPKPKTPLGISDKAFISDSATVPASCSIGHHVVIADDVVLGEHVTIKDGSIIEQAVKLGDHTIIESNVTIKYETEIGRHCHIYSGAIIGSEGFGYAEEDGRWLKIPQVGRVVIHDHVDVGANTTIDRGALDDTVIEEGVKLDNLIQIGHNCTIGAHTVIAGCTGIAGSAKIGRHCKIGGAAMILGHLDIVDHVTVSPGSMITRSLLEPNTYTALMPFQRHKDWLHTASSIKKIDQLVQKVKLLEQKIKNIQCE